VAVSKSGLAGRLAALERMHVISMEHFGQQIHFRFRHGMTQQVIYGSMLGADRARFHRRVAKALEVVYAGDLALHYDLLAHHHYSGGSPSRAAMYLIQAAESAAKVRADREAQAHYERAENLLSKCDNCPARCVDGVRLALLLGRSKVNYRLVRIREAIQDARMASSLAKRLADLGSLGEALSTLGEIAVEQARYVDATVVLRYAFQPLRALNDRKAMSRVILLTGRVQSLQGQFEDALETIDRAMSLHDPLDDAAHAAACKSWQGAIDFARGQHTQALESLQRGLVLAERAKAQDVIAQILARIAQVQLYRGKWGYAYERAQEALRHARTLGRPLTIADTRRVFAFVLMRIGAYQDADAHLADVFGVLANAEWRVELALARLVAGENCMALGRYEQAREHLDNSLALGLESNTVEIICRAQIGMSKLAAMEGDWPYAQLWCTEAKARARRAGLEMVISDARLALAQVYLARGELVRAQREGLQALEAGERLRCPYTRLRALALLGTAMMGLYQDVRAERLYAEADEIVGDLAETLPVSLREAFLAQSLVDKVQTRSASLPVGELA